jgi:hypothetical protein
MLSCFVIAVMPAIHYINISSNTFSIYKWSKTFSEHTGNDRKHISVHNVKPSHIHTRNQDQFPDQSVHSCIIHECDCKLYQVGVSVLRLLTLCR